MAFWIDFRIAHPLRDRVANVKRTPLVRIAIGAVRLPEPIDALLQQAGTLRIPQLIRDFGPHVGQKPRQGLQTGRSTRWERVPAYRREIVAMAQIRDASLEQTDAPFIPISGFDRTLR
jgi:hypothetical protein